jgi:hypothetical protein
MSTTDKAGSISISSSSVDDDFFSLFVVGSDIKIVQDDNTSRGWILNPPRRLEGNINYIEIQGLAYAARLQKVIINEKYTADATISEIVLDLFGKYATDYELSSVVCCNQTCNIDFPDVFLFDAMEQLATLSGYEWYIDEPTPETIPALDTSHGWAESMTAAVHACPLPSDTLYPADDLYPC